MTSSLLQSYYVASSSMKKAMRWENGGCSRREQPHIVITGLDIDSTLSLCKDVAESIMAKVQGLIRK